MSCIYKYKGKDYTKDEFYSLVRATMVQPRTVQKYTKILFPTGNTASKVEGHSTLEEFKRQKEDRIKFIQENPENLPEGDIILESKEVLRINKENKSYQIISKEDYDSGWNFGEAISYKKALQLLKDNNKSDDVTLANNQINEINQLKQELERLEKEGFGALKPIYNFYENTVTNILKKQGYNPVLITDEYGNTWNEVELSDDLLENFTIGSFKPRIPIPIPINNSLEELYREDVENSNNTCTFDIGK